jgi:UDP-4-amino-4-deoxy-L-arabinose formyltransferase/UDP-glucuronic acid dehydrogenase (UDP-4-keto-hexauronic acid decarboxylating)
MGLVVMAYQEIGYVCLEVLIQAGAEVAAVFTHQDDPDEEIWFRSVAELAREAGIPVYTPNDPNTLEVLELVGTAEPDFIFSFYYRYLLSADLLALARCGAYNLHGSMLPKYRGRAPVNWVLVNGEQETGVTLHRMTAKPDAGPIVAQKVVLIDERDTVRELYAKMVDRARQLMAETWPRMALGDYRETPQDESGATYFGGRKPSDGLIDWTWPAKRVYDLCRAVTHPYPGAFTHIEQRRLLIWDADYETSGETKAAPGTVLGLDSEKGIEVACGQGRIYIRSAQWVGEPETGWSDLRRLGLKNGDRF